MIRKLILISSAAVCYIISMSLSPLVEANNNNIGFTIDLIHRDSPHSPLYDTSLSQSQRLANALRRSFNRIHRFEPNWSRKSPVSEITSDNGEFIMTYSIGSPPVPSLGIADTGSDIIWTQCKPCKQCFKQKLPLFNPKRSSTYKVVPCNSNFCKGLEEATCHKVTKTCLYKELYGDNSFTNGNLATESFTLGSTTGKNISLPNLTFGCGHENGGIFTAGESGIVGLGGGKASLVSQLRPLIQGKFSYCLVSLLSKGSKKSKLSFGQNAVVSGEGVVSTPIVPKSLRTFYYLTLKGISVANERLELRDPITASNISRGHQEGNIIIDSGTTLTFLPQDLYIKLENAVKKRIKLHRVMDPAKILSLCYLSKKNNVQVPDITVHFKGADVKLNAENTFIRTSKDSICLAFAPAQPVPVYGNLAQTNFLIGYDTEKRTVSFKQVSDCSKS